MSSKQKNIKPKSIKTIKFEIKNQELKRKLGIEYDDIARQPDNEVDLLYEKFNEHREIVLKKYWGV